MKYMITASILSFALIVIACFAAQAPNRSMDFSYHFLSWLGWDMDIKTLRKVIHIPMYFLLGISLYAFGQVRKWKISTIALLGVTIGMVEELLKHFIPGRDFDSIDISMDCIGLMFAIGIGSFFSAWKKTFREARH